MLKWHQAPEKLPQIGRKIILVHAWIESPSVGGGSLCFCGTVDYRSDDQMKAETIEFQEKDWGEPLTPDNENYEQLIFRDNGDVFITWPNSEETPEREFPYSSHIGRYRLIDMTFEEDIDRDDNTFNPLCAAGCLWAYTDEKNPTC